MPAHTGPGWFPVSYTEQRYWDGTRWTDHVAPIPPALLKGTNGSVLFDGSFVCILRYGLRARTVVGKGEKRIPVSSLTAVQWKPAGAVVNGFIEFTLGGGNERRSRFGSQTMDAVRDENAIVFTRHQMPGFQGLRAAVERAIATSALPVPPTLDRPAAPSVLEQLEQLGRLRHTGVITEEDFVRKKAELLRRL